MQFFYSTQIQEGEVLLSRSEVSHMQKSLRKSIGSEIVILDGRGRFYHCVLVNLGSNGGVAKINRQDFVPEPPHTLHIAFAPTKNSTRTEWFLEKATEIGIAQISMIETARTERHKVNQERFKRIMVSALKQSGGAYLPELVSLQSYHDFVTSDARCDQKFIAHCARFPLPYLSKVMDSKLPSSHTLIMIGPEGDFTAEEIELAVQNKFVEISLGPARLRTETAGVYVSAMASLLNQTL